MDAGERAQFRLAGGWGSYLDWMHAQLDPRLCRVLLATAVRRIAWSRRAAHLFTDAGEFRARAVLVTLPVGVLQAPPGAEGSVRFDPDPPRLRRALAGLAMGDVIRLVLRFRNAFWGSADSSRLARRRPEGEPTFFHVPGAEFPTWWTSSPVESSTLTMWAGGRAARSLLGLGRAEILRRALAALRVGAGRRAGRGPQESARRRKPRLVERPLFEGRLQFRARRGSFGRTRARSAVRGDAVLRGRSDHDRRSRDGDRRPRERAEGGPAHAALTWPSELAWSARGTAFAAFCPRDARAPPANPN